MLTVGMTLWFTEKTAENKQGIIALKNPIFENFPSIEDEQTLMEVSFYSYGWDTS
ncbi:hypothetical protein ACFDTO_25710 [Microbacteriaceae bacterium 4G12]